MTELLRVKARWQGFPGAPGYTVFHLRDFATDDAQAQYAQAGVDKVRTFFDGIKAWLAYGVNIQVQGEVELINAEDGKLIDVIATTQPALVTSTMSVTDRYAAAVGSVITWRTGAVRNGRRIKGRTFIVPMSGNSYHNDGTLHTDSMGALQTATTALRTGTTSPRVGVYSRPSAPGATDGQWAFATSHSIPDMSAVLRSRRD